MTCFSGYTTLCIHRDKQTKPTRTATRSHLTVCTPLYRELLTVLFAVAILGDPLSLTNAVGVGLCTAGAALYHAQKSGYLTGRKIDLSHLQCPRLCAYLTRRTRGLYAFFSVCPHLCGGRAGLPMLDITEREGYSIDAKSNQSRRRAKTEDAAGSDRGDDEIGCTTIDPGHGNDPRFTSPHAGSLTIGSIHTDLGTGAATPSGGSLTLGTPPVRTSDSTVTQPDERAAPGGSTLPLPVSSASGRAGGPPPASARSGRSLPPSVCPATGRAGAPPPASARSGRSLPPPVSSVIGRAGGPSLASARSGRSLPLPVSSAIGRADGPPLASARSGRSLSPPVSSAIGRADGPPPASARSGRSLPPPVSPVPGRVGRPYGIWRSGRGSVGLGARGGGEVVVVGEVELEEAGGFTPGVVLHRL